MATIGQLIKIRRAPDTFDAPYDVTKSVIDADVSSRTVALSRPGPLPPPPPVVLSSPSPIGDPPNVSLSSPGSLPPPPPVDLSVPARLPPPPAVSLSVPSAVPNPPVVSLSSPAALPALPAVQLSQPADLPEPPKVNRSKPAGLPSPPVVPLSRPTDLPPPPVLNFKNYEPPHGAAPIFEPRQYTDRSSGQGERRNDIEMHEKHLERLRNLPPGQMLRHSLTQGFLFALNSNGKIWNPLLTAPPPVIGDMILPAIDTIPLDPMVALGLDYLKVNNPLVSMGKDAHLANLNYNTEHNTSRETEQFTIRELVDDSLRGISDVMTDQVGSLMRFPGSNTDPIRLANIFTSRANVSIRTPKMTANPSSRDPLAASAFYDGIVPAGFDSDNSDGYVGSRQGEQSPITDNEAYLPLCFTDLRPAGGIYRTVYFRPFNVSVAESISPQWNNENYTGRADPVMTYTSTTRTVNLAFELIAFGPEDLATIYKKLNILASMAYPEYDKNLSLKSGPVTRLRVGDLISSHATEGVSRGIPGVLTDVTFDYADSLWELETDIKVPRHVKVSVAFMVLHDRVMGRYTDGTFGGIAYTTQVNETPSIMSTTKKLNIDSSYFRNIELVNKNVDTDPISESHIYSELGSGNPPSQQDPTNTNKIGSGGKKGTFGGGKTTGKGSGGGWDKKPPLDPKGDSASQKLRFIDGSGGERDWNMSEVRVGNNNVGFIPK